MSPQLKEFITAVLLDLAENCDWTISPTGQIEHSPFFEVAEKHLHLVEPVDWKFKRAEQIRYEMRKLTEELKSYE